MMVHVDSLIQANVRVSQNSVLEKLTQDQHITAESETGKWTLHVDCIGHLSLPELSSV